MGLDGISVNQLRITREFNSSEQNTTAQIAQNDKTVGGISSGQWVDPDKNNKEHANGQDFFEDEEDNEDEEETSEDKEVTVKYDLSKVEKYSLKLDNENNIIIVENSTQQEIQKISAQQLSRFVGFLASPQGAIVNRKF